MAEDIKVEESKLGAAGHHSAKHKKKFKFKWKFLSLLLLIVLIASVFTSGFGVRGGSVPAAVSANSAANKAVAFVNEELLTPGQSASLVDVTESKGLYVVTLNVDGQEFVSYVTKDAEIFFPSGANMGEVKASVTPADITPSASYPQTDKPEVQLFVMSYCPYGNVAEEAIRPVIELLGGDVDYSPQYIFYENYATTLRSRGFDALTEDYCTDEDETYCSMHGMQELNQGIRELCVYRDQKDKFWDFTEAMNDKCNSKNADTCWEAVAKDVGVDVDAVKSCQESDIDTILAQQVADADERDIGGSPTLTINGKRYSGSRTSEGYKQAICSAFSDAPDACGDVVLSTAEGTAEGTCG